MTHAMIVSDITSASPIVDLFSEIPSELTVTDAPFGNWKCGCCKQVQSFGCKQIWIPGDVERSTLVLDMKYHIESCTYFEAWCITCVKSLFLSYDVYYDEYRLFRLQVICITFITFIIYAILALC